MNILKEYILQNWALILILLAFIVLLFITVFLDKKTIKRMFLLIIFIFLLSISVFFEFYLFDKNELPTVRLVLVAIRYSSIPIIIALLLLTLVRKTHWYILIPAFILAIINIVSIFTGIVFSIASDGKLDRGILGYLPYIGIGIYCVFLIYTLVKRSNKQISEILPIIFLSFSFITGLIFPLIIGPDYSKIFCTTVAIALFVYYVFMIIQLTKKDALTGLLNRQAYYSTITNSKKDITAIVSIDMNGLKKINDTEGHLAGDEAIISVSNCLFKASKFKYSFYRIGGDEFIIICKKTTNDELIDLVSNIEKNISETKYSISIGYSFNDNPDKDIELMVKNSDDMMYKNKAEYYAKLGIEHR